MVIGTIQIKWDVSVTYIAKIPSDDNAQILKCRCMGWHSGWGSCGNMSWFTCIFTKNGNIVKVVAWRNTITRKYLPIRRGT